MNRRELVRYVARLSGQPQVFIDALLQQVTDGITDGLRRDGVVKIARFGTFEKRHRPARPIRHPQTGEMTTTKPTTAVKFKTSPTLNEALDETG